MNRPEDVEAVLEGVAAEAKSLRVFMPLENLATRKRTRKLAGHLERTLDYITSLEGKVERLDGEVSSLKALLAQRTADIAKAQPDPSIRRISAQALEALAEAAEAQWACAETEEERIEATALEMLVEWQRTPPARAALQGVES